MSQPETDGMGELEALAAAAGAEGASNDRETLHKALTALEVLGSGVGEAFQALLKGRGGEEPPPEGEPVPPEGEGEEPPPEGESGEDDEQPADDVEGEEAPEDDEAPGYEDMRMGEHSEEVVDATDLVLSLNSNMQRLADGIEALTKAVRDGNADIGGRVELLEKAMSAGLPVLAKGIVDVKEGLLNTPAAVAGDPARRATRSVVRRHLTQGLHQANALSKTELAKGQAHNIFNESDLRHYKQHGVFPGSEADHKATVAAIRAA